MKKIFSLILCCFLLCSCRSMEKVTSPVTDKIKFGLDITYYNEKYHCSGQINGEKMSFTLNEPEELAGMELSLDKGVLTVSYKGLTYTPSDSSMPTQFVCSNIYYAIDSIRNSDANPKSDGENYVLSGKAEGKEYIFTFSPAGYPLNLKLPSDAFYAEFSDITVITSK